jgi:hypothetical protein
LLAHVLNPPSAVSFLAIFDYGACASRLRFIIENFAVMGSMELAQNLLRRPCPREFSLLHNDERLRLSFPVHECQSGVRAEERSTFRCAICYPLFLP